MSVLQAVGRRRAAGRFARLLVLPCLGVVPATAMAQERQPRFRAEAELVLVDVVVLDRKGEPVEGLGQADFEVREDGTPQTIARFEAIGLEQSPPSRPPRARFVSTNAAATPQTPPRSLVVVFDDAQLSRATAERAKAAITSFLNEGLRDGDDVLLVSTATQSWWSARLPEGAKHLRAVLDRFEGRRPVDTSSSRISDYEAMRLHLNRDAQVGAQVVRRFHENGVLLDPRNRDAAQQARELGLGEGHPLLRVKAAEAYANVKARNLATLRALERVAAALAEGRGRKSVVLVSDGFVYDHSLPEFRSVVRAMGEANAAVYFLDARGLPGPGELGVAEVGRATEERDVLTFLGQGRLESEGAESVALDTGGFALRNPSDLEGGLQRIARESRAYYLIGYSSTNPRRDGKFRKLEVEVRRPDVRVRARKGYYAEEDGKRQTTTARGLDPRLRQALDSPYAIGGLPLRMASYVLGPASTGKAAVLLAADADPAAIAFDAGQERHEAALDSYLVVAARDTGENHSQEKEIALSLPAEVRAQLADTWVPIFRELELSPGAYQARLLLRDRSSGRAGTVRHDFEVPALESFRVSTPILTDRMQGDPKAGPPRPVPLARRAFPSGSNLLYLFEVHGAARDGAAGLPRVASRCEVRRGDGTTLVRSEMTAIQPGPQGQLSRQVPLSLVGAAAGDYEILLTIEDQVAGRALEVRDPFTVVAPPPSRVSGRP
jgi:VWFA-related protein